MVLALPSPFGKPELRRVMPKGGKASREHGVKGLRREQAHVTEWQASGLQGRYSPREDAEATATLIKRGSRRSGRLTVVSGWPRTQAPGLRSGDWQPEASRLVPSLLLQGEVLTK